MDSTIARSERRHLLVVQPDPLDALDNFESWLVDEGVHITTLRPYEGEPIPTELVHADAVLVLGGSMSSLDDQHFPWLEDIRELLRNTHLAGQPALGICLGAQLMAQAHGGRMAVGRHGTEAGLISVRWHSTANGDALLGGLPQPFLVGALHSDAIETLPPNASWLGESAQYPHQAFRVGVQSWGVQFHPEVNASTMRMWLSCMERDEGMETCESTDIADDFEEQQATVLAGTAIVARRFANLIGSS